MGLKYMDLPLDEAERARILLKNGVHHVTYYPDQRFNEEAWAFLKAKTRTICEFSNTDLHSDLSEYYRNKRECREREKYKDTEDLGRKNKDGVRVLDDDNSVFYSVIINVLEKELEFRLNLVESCVEWAKQRHTDAVRLEKIGRRIALHKNVWPFPKYEPNMVRVRRTRPGERSAVPAEYPKAPDPYHDKDDLENLLDD